MRRGDWGAVSFVALCARSHGLVHDGWLRIERGESGELRFRDRSGRALDGVQVGSGAARIRCATAHGNGATQEVVPEVVPAPAQRR